MVTTIQLRVTGKKGMVDGYVETMLGTFALTNQLLNPPVWNKRYRENGIVQVYLTLTLKAPPLGHQGEQDIPELPFKSGEYE